MKRQRLLSGQFEYVGARRGYWATLAAPNGHRVTLTEHPGTLLAMLRADVLTGEAKRDAEQLLRLAAH